MRPFSLLSHSTDLYSALDSSNRPHASHVHVPSAVSGCPLFQEKPWFPLLDDEYKFINDVPLEERVRSVKPPTRREDCEVLLMVGLPGSGKTYWATEQQKLQPDKRWYVLGTNNIIDRMKVHYLPL